jgi:cytidine deaminase
MSPARLDAADRALLEAARRARAQAYAPYSKFKVGAAIRTRGGRVFAGCNVENAAYGAGICAERGAVMQAVAAGMQRGDLVAVAVYTRDDAPTPPCGMCLQVLREFGADVDFLLVNGRSVRRATMRELLPVPFTGFLEQGTKPPRRRS